MNTPKSARSHKNGKRRMNKKGLTRLCLGGLLAFGFAQAAAADSLIVRATGPSASQFSVGKTLTSDQSFTLKQDDELVVIHEGTAKTFTGPGEFTLQQNVEKSSNAVQVAMLITQNQTKMRARGGFTRSAMIQKTDVQPPNLWLLDSRMSGNFCVAQPNWLFIWRPETNAETTITLQAAEAAQASSLTFASGASYQRWPVDSLSVENGRQYTLSSADGSEARTITFHPIGTIPEDVEATAQALADSGCTTQLNRLVDSLTQKGSTL